MNIGDRIKRYEAVSSYKLMPREAVIIRVDGKCFHAFAAKMEKPFDMKLVEAMIRAGERTAKEMMGFRLGYHQSDEFTFFLINTNAFETEAWFDNNLSKLISISASMFTAYFNEEMGGTSAIFDARAFNCPIDDVPNVFIWRQRDWERNSLQMFSRSFFSHQQLHNKKKTDMHEMLHSKEKNWADLSDIIKNGTFITKEGSRLHIKMNYESIKNLLTSVLEQ